MIAQGWPTDCAASPLEGNSPPLRRGGEAVRSLHESLSASRAASGARGQRNERPPCLSLCLTVAQSNLRSKERTLFESSRGRRIITEQSLQRIIVCYGLAIFIREPTLIQSSDIQKLDEVTFLFFSPLRVRDKPSERNCESGRK